MWRLALLLGAGLLASAAVCWVAANWPYATAMQKLAGVQALLALGALLAALRLWRRPDSIGVTSAAANALGLAAVLVGALFALIGQTYQTGADPWQLFAVWTLLILPWVLILPTVFLLCLAALVANVALVLFLMREISAGWTVLAACMTALNLTLLGLRELAGMRLAADDPWRVAPRALMMALSGWWLACLLLALLDSRPYGLLLGWPGLFLGAALAAAYTRLRPDAAMLSLLGLTACAALGVLIVDALGMDAGLPVAIVGLVLVFIFGARHLLAVARAGSPRRHGTEEPWFVSAFRLVLLSLAALLGLLFVMFVLRLDGQAVGGLGAILLAGGLWVVRTQVARPVGRDLGIVLVTAGYALTTVWVSMVSEPLSLAMVAGVVGPAVLIYTVAPVFTLRLLSALAGVGMVVLYVWQGPWVLGLWGGTQDRWIGMSYERLLVLSLAALAAWRWVAGAPGRSGHVPLAWALAGLALTAGWWAPALHWGGAMAGGQGAWVGGVAAVLAVLPLYGLATMLRGAGWRLGLGAAGLLLVASAGWLGAPGVAVALTWLLMGRVLHRPALLGLSGVALLTYLAQFYYQLETPLLHKAWVLGATGAWLLLGALVLGGWHQGWRRRKSAPQALGMRAGRWRAPAVIAGLLVVLAVANSTILQRERVLREGREVVLALAPVDPRSLMQGDYMVLRYAVADEVEGLLRESAALADTVRADGQGMLLLMPDVDGVHRLRGIESLAQAGGQAASAQELRLAFRLRDDEVWIVTDAWFFPEGQGEHYGQARYGMFKVDSQGMGVLVDLLDEHRVGLKSRALPQE